MSLLETSQAQIEEFLKKNKRKILDVEYRYGGCDNNQDPPEQWETADLKVLVVFLSAGANRGVSNTNNALNHLIHRELGKKAFVDFCYYVEKENQELYQKNNIPFIFGNCSHRPASEYDLVCVCDIIIPEVINMPVMLMNSDIPLTIEQRREKKLPMFVVGGAAANESPIMFGPVKEDGKVVGHSFMDAAMFGYGENVLNVFCEKLAEFKAKGGDTHDEKAVEDFFLDNNILHDRLFFPIHYEWVYGEDRFTLKEIKRTDDRVPEKVKYNRVDNTTFEGFPDKIFHLSGSNNDSHDIQISTGCTGQSSACSFCMEGTMAGNYHERSLDSIEKDMVRVTRGAAPNTISYYSFNLNYYSRFMDLLYTGGRHFSGTTLLNERLDVVANAPEQLNLAKALGLRRMSGAIEGYGERLRNKVLNKNLPRETLMQAVRNIYNLKLMHLKCVTSDTWIFTNSGMKHAEDIIVGDKVWDGSSFKSVLSVGENPVDRVLKIRLYNGMSLRGLPDHKVKTKNRGWVELQDLHIGDLVLINRGGVSYISEHQRCDVDLNKSRHSWKVKNPKNSEYHLDDDIAKLVGWVSGDGCFTARYVGFFFSNREEDVAEEILGIIRDKFGYDAKRFEGVGCYHYEYSTSFFKKFMGQFFIGRGAREKVFSDIVMESPLSVKKQLLRYLFSSDGTRKFWVEKGYTRRHKRIQLSSYCREKLEQVQLLLNEFGISSRIRDKYLDIMTADIQKFWDIIGFVGVKSRLTEEEEVILKEDPGLDNHLEVEKLISIEEDSPDVTVAIEVEGHEFVTNGILSHNCGMIMTGLETEEDIEDFESEIEEFFKIRDEMGASTSLQFNTTPLILYAQTPLRYLPRKTAEMSFNQERTMHKFIEFCRSKNIRCKFNGRGIGTYLEQLVLDFGPVGTSPLVEMVKKGLRYERNFGDKDKEIIVEVLKADGRDPLFFTGGRDPEWIFPVDFQDYLSDELKKDWLKRTETMNFEKRLCLRTPANMENVKCHGCKACESPEQIKYMTQREVKSQHTFDEVVNMLSGSKSVTGVRVVVKIQPGWDIYAKKSLNHYIAAQFLNNSKELGDELGSTELSKAFFAVGKGTASWHEANGFKSFTGGTYAFDIELRERVPITKFTELIDQINEKARVFKVLKVLPNENKQMSISIDSKVLMIAYTDAWSVSQIKDKVSNLSNQVKVGVKSMGGKEVALVEYPEFKESLVLASKGNVTYLAMTAGLKYNPYLLLSTITGKGFDQCVQDWKVDIIDNFVDTMATCPKCNQKLGISYFTGELQKVCSRDYAKILLAKLSGRI